jgi:hypothetical protein
VWRNTERLGGTGLEQRAGTRLSNGLGATTGTQLAEQIADMFLDGVQGNHQGIGDLLIRGALGKQAQDFLFTPGEWFKRGR